MRLARWTYRLKAKSDFTRTVITTAEASEDIAWSKFLHRNMPGVGSNPLVKDDWEFVREEFVDLSRLPPIKVTALNEVREFRRRKGPVADDPV